MTAPNRTIANTPSRSPSGAARLVLLVDPSKAHRRMLRIQLERAGYRVVEASDGNSALTICSESEPDLILSDWLLTGTCGLDLCRAHRALPRRGYGFFILLTTRNDAVDVTQGMQAGADDFLTKPISGPELLARIGAAERVLDMQDTLSAANERLRSALDKLNAAQDQMTADLREARKLQQALNRERQRVFGMMRLSALMRPAGMIGGDLVGFHQINDRTLALHAVDVSGHGVASALMTARIAAQLETLSLDPTLGPSDVVRALNDLTLEGLQTDNYLTMVYGRLNLHTGRLHLVQAGHPYPIIQRKNGMIETIGVGGLPVGVVRGATYEELVVTLREGDRLIIASDGITEATNRRGDFLGLEGLKRILGREATLTGYALLESICWQIAEFSSGERQDDVSALLLEHMLPGSMDDWGQEIGEF